MPATNNKHPDSFHRSIMPLLILGQVCGLVPVRGIFGPHLKFSWVNLVHFYGFGIFLITLFFDCCYTIDNLKTEIRIDGFASTIFYTVCLLTTIFFLEIAKKLPEISQNFIEVEKNMKEYGYPKRLGLQVKIFLLLFIFFAIVEHGVLVFINVKHAWRKSADGKHSFGHMFYNSYFQGIAKRMDYSGVRTIILLWVNIVCTFNWNYLDFFIVVISMEIFTRFSLINSKLKNGNLGNENNTFWEKLTTDYNRLSLLTKKLDKALSKVILTSLFSNTYHLSLQLVRTLKINGTLFEMTYFYFSLTYLIVRLLLTFFFAAKVLEESKKPWPVIFSLENPCHEAIRLAHQVCTDDIAFTGNRFFTINNKFFISIIGTIVTYQGALLQFNSLQANFLK